MPKILITCLASYVLPQQNLRAQDESKSGSLEEMDHFPARVLLLMAEVHFYGQN